MKQALIITYYWPPSGGSGVQRWLKFVKYLPQFGWKPIVYTPENPSFGIKDESLLKDVSGQTEVIRSPIWEPYDLFMWFSNLLGKKKRMQDGVLSTGGKSLFQKLSTWIRGNFFIPDPRIFWVNPSVKFLSHYLETNPVDVVISTGPPHSCHLIALRISEKFNLPWLADFRDPWTTMDYYKDLKLTAWADRKHHALEHKILTGADAVSVIGNIMKKEFEEKRKREVIAIPNGYDPQDFELATEIPLDKDFSLVFAGSFFPRQNPDALWQAIFELKEEQHPGVQFLKIKLIGRVDPVILDSIHAHHLDEYLAVETYQPHTEIVKRLRSARVLLLPINNFEGARWMLTGKLFEYLAAQRPILCIGPTDGEAAKILDETKAGEAFDFSDVKGVKEFLSRMYAQYENGSPGTSSSETGSYSRQELTGRLAAELDTLYLARR
jgi:glycosyltransferase involved in cell wall biosynthesis